MLSFTKRFIKDLFSQLWNKFRQLFTFHVHFMSMDQSSSVDLKLACELLKRARTPEKKLSKKEMTQTLTATSCKIKVLRMGPHSTREPTSPSSPDVEVGGSSGSLSGDPTQYVSRDEFDNFKEEFRARLDQYVTRDEFENFKEELRARLDRFVEKDEFDNFKEEVRARLDRIESQLVELASLHSKVDQILLRL